MWKPANTSADGCGWCNHGSLALLRDVVEERDDGGGGGGIQTGGWLVEDDHAGRLTSATARRGACAGRRKTLEEETSSPSVLAGGETRDGQKLVHLRVEGAGVEVGPEVLERKLEVLPRGHGGPQDIFAGHVDGLLDERASLIL